MTISGGTSEYKSMTEIRRRNYKCFVYVVRGRSIRNGNDKEDGPYKEDSLWVY